MDFTNWLLFSSIALLAALSPGPAILLVTSHSFAYGLQKSLATILGNISGLFIMSSLSVAGLSAIILHTPVVYTIVKLIGAAYLIYLGVKLIKNGFGTSSEIAKVNKRAKPPSLKKLYAHGVLIALSNPKAIAFTTALFPQFVDQSLPILPQFSILVATIMSLSFTCLLAYAYLAASASNKVSDTGRLPNVLSKLFGLIFIISGALLAGVTQRQT